MMTSPSPLAATVEPMVAVPTLMTSESRIPSRMSGIASGSSTDRSRSPALMPMPEAASRTCGGTVFSPVMVFSKIGRRP